MNHALYRRQIGEVFYLATSTRPNISYAVNVLARNVHETTFRHKDHVSKSFRYLKGAKPLSIMFPRSPNHYGVTVYSDTAWKDCRLTRQSTTSPLINDDGASAAWKSVRQLVVALSSAEVEYIALNTTGREVRCLQRIYAERLELKPLRDC